MHSLIDSHCHLDFDIFSTDREDVINRAREENISDIVIPGVQRKNWDTIKSITHQFSNLHPCYGIHPGFIDSHTKNDVLALEKFITENPCVALGECGLDYRKNQPDRKLQQDFFEAQLEVANKIDKPVIIHSVYATEVVIQTLRKYKTLTGMVHGYSGSLEQAMQLIKMGFYISFGGSVTYENAFKLRLIVEAIPLTSLLIETDAPDQPDAEHVAQRNEPSYLKNILNCITQLRNENKEEIARQTTLNAQQLFQL